MKYYTRIRNSVNIVILLLCNMRVRVGEYVYMRRRTSEEGRQGY